MNDLSVIVAIDIVVFAAWGVMVGYVGAKLSTSILDSRVVVGLLRTHEAEVGRYRRLRIRRWKDRIPEAGQLFGGMSKRRLGGFDQVSLTVFAREARRAELVHWANLAIVFLFALWNPLALFIVMMVAALVANAPCIAIQRYNRCRIASLG